MKNNQAVAYLRSSKDRSDVSIDAQRRALHELAQVRGFAIVGEFADAVESGKDDDRPGFQQLLAALRDPARTWQIVLALDTSRVARRRALSLIFEEHECARRGVRVIYKSIPDSEPMTEMLLRSILQAMDEWHSLNSKAKGLAGMAENVRQGFRAGGRAPRGYRLEYTSTGAIRDGSPVLKSKLVVGDDAPLVRDSAWTAAIHRHPQRTLYVMKLTAFCRKTLHDSGVSNSWSLPVLQDISHLRSVVRMLLAFQINCP